MSSTATFRVYLKSNMNLGFQQTGSRKIAHKCSPAAFQYIGITSATEQT